MAEISKIFQVTPQIILTYSYDKFSTEGSEASNKNDFQLTYHRPMLYQSLDRSICFLDCANESILGDLHNNIFHTKFENANNDTNLYLGWYGDGVESVDYGACEVTSWTEQAMSDLLDDNWIRKVYSYQEDASVPYAEDKTTYDGISETKRELHWDVGTLAYDKLRIYLLSGYLMNNCTGISVKIKALTNDYYVNSIGKYVPRYAVLGNWVFLKEQLGKLTQWVTTPLYINSKFYDRYIEVEVPSIYALGRYHDTSTLTGKVKVLADWLNVSQDSKIMIEFATIEDDAVTLPKDDKTIAPSKLLDRSYLDTSLLLNTMSFTLGTNKVEGNLKLNSNADMFNVRLYEDTDTNCIVYYPVYGEAYDAVDLNTTVMYNIESGAIPMTDDAWRDSNLTADEFYDTYGEDARKWMIINEISVTYNYSSILKS